MSKCYICGGDFVEYKQGGISVQICKKCKSVHILRDDFEQLAKYINPECKIVDLFALEEFATTEEKNPVKTATLQWRKFIATV